MQMMCQTVTYSREEELINLLMSCLEQLLLEKHSEKTQHALWFGPNCSPDDLQVLVGR